MNNFSLIRRAFPIVAMFLTTATFSAKSLTDNDTPNTMLANKVAIAQSELVYLQTDIGQIVIQLTSLQSPLATERFKNLVDDQFYSDLRFYRVIDGFVAQAGEGFDQKELSDEISKKTEFRSTLPAEFTKTITDTKAFQVIQSPELFAPETGFWNGFPAGRDLTTKEQWLLHCPGTVALGRGNKADSATTEFYIVLGQAPRHLDRNMSVVGRVIDGMPVAQAMPRGERSHGGIIEPISLSTKIISAKIGSSMSKEKQITYFIENTKADKFQTRIENARYKTAPFFAYPGNGNIDVCYHQPSITKE